MMTKIIDSNGMVSEKDLLDLEIRIGAALPDSYRAFLSKYNGGYPQPDGFDFSDGSDGSSVDAFLEVNGSKNKDLFEYYKQYKPRIPGGYLPIAKDPGGNLVLIELNNLAGKVYYWDHENEVEDGALPWMDNVHLISDNFDDFIKGLYEVEI